MTRLIGTITVVLTLSSAASLPQALTAAGPGSRMGAWTLTRDSLQGLFEQDLVFEGQLLPPP